MVFDRALPSCSSPRLPRPLHAHSPGPCLSLPKDNSWGNSNSRTHAHEAASVREELGFRPLKAGEMCIPVEGGLRREGGREEGPGLQGLRGFSD